MSEYLFLSRVFGRVFGRGFALFRTIFNALPITCPFLTPLKGQFTAKADLGGKAVLGFSLHRGSTRGILMALNSI